MGWLRRRREALTQQGYDRGYREGMLAILTATRPGKSKMMLHVNEIERDASLLDTTFYMGDNARFRVPILTPIVPIENEVA